MPSRRPLISLAVLACVAACATPVAPPPPASAAGGAGGVEDIYVVRSVRESRAPAGEFCSAAKTGFAATLEDRYAFRAVVTRSPDGKVIDTLAHEVGSLRACYQGAVGPEEVGFYAEGVVAGIAVTGRGKCVATAADFPEPGITSLRCFLVLSDLPAPYAAGVLTTNSISSRALLGERSEPPGYVQPSIATIRLWHKR